MHIPALCKNAWWTSTSFLWSFVRPQIWWSWSQINTIDFRPITKEWIYTSHAYQDELTHIVTFRNLDWAKLLASAVCVQFEQEHRQVCNSGGAGMLLSASMQIFSLKIQCTDRMNLKNMGGFQPPIVQWIKILWYWHSIIMVTLCSVLGNQDLSPKFNVYFYLTQGGIVTH